MPNYDPREHMRETDLRTVGLGFSTPLALSRPPVWSSERPGGSETRSAHTAEGSGPVGRHTQTQTRKQVEPRT